MLYNELKTLKSAKETLGIQPASLLSSELDFLVDVWKRDKIWLDESLSIQERIQHILAFKANIFPCGCMGSIPGEPWCPCMIQAKKETYSLDVAIRLLETLEKG